MGAPTTHACSVARIRAGELAEQAETLSGTLGLMAAGGAGVAFISGLGEPETLGADTPVTLTGAGIATYAGMASTGMGALAGGLKSYSAGNPAAIGGFVAEHLADRLTQGLLKLHTLQKLLPEPARAVIDKSLGVVYASNSPTFKNACVK